MRQPRVALRTICHVIISSIPYRAYRAASRSGQLTSRVPSGDAVAVGVLLLLTLGVTWQRVGDGRGLWFTDVVTAFLPWFDHLGDRLRAGDIPGWSSASFSGAPFAGDPESGWMYLPAMTLFALLPPVAAFKTLVFVQLALGGLSTYALGRLLGLSPIGGLVAAVSFEFGAFAYYSGCCPIFQQLAAWIPLSWLGVELAFRAERSSTRLAWWFVAGFALSQQIGAWTGQGSTYALLSLAAFIGYRGFFPPGGRRPPFGARLQQTLLHGGAVVAIGIGLAAAGLLPRLDFVSRSTRAGGESFGDGFGGWSVQRAFEAMLTTTGTGRWFVGAGVLALALLAPLIGRGRLPVAFLSLYSVAVVVLTLKETPLHTALFQIPYFLEIHSHTPSRILVVLGIGPALLAGATVDGIADRARSPWLFPALLLPLGVFVVVAHELADEGLRTDLGLGTVAAVTAVIGLFAVFAGPARQLVPRFTESLPAVAGMLLAAILFVSLAGPLVDDGISDPDMASAADSALRDGSAATAPGAAAYLQEQRRVAPVRYFGFDGWRIRKPSWASRQGYRSSYRDPAGRALLVANRAFPLGLEEIQGYNPVQLERYSRFIDALNGVRQEYHETNVLANGLDSPLLDLLGARFVVVPAAVPPGRPDLLHASQRLPTVYRDADVRILENRQALPRAWIVHEAREADPDTILTELATGQVDPRTTALFEVKPPRVRKAAEGSAETVTIASHDHDRVTADVTAAADGMVVFAEVYDDGWRAFVDGEPARLYQVDYLLRGVAVPAGSHAVELRYEPDSLRTGLTITLATLAAVVAGWIALRWREWRAAKRIPLGY